jgi:RNA polymerase sigma-70 factor (ECF subfamily)
MALTQKARVMIEQHPFSYLLPRQAVPLRGRAMKLTSNLHRAEDLVQTTLMKAWASRDSYLPESNLRAWLFTIMRNTFFSDLRKNCREVEDVDGALAAALAEEPRQDHVLALKELMAAILLLPQVQRRPLVLMGAMGFSQSEVATSCGCTIGAVKSRVSRARATLSAALLHDRAIRVEGLGKDLALQSGKAALLHKSADGRTAAIRGQVYPATFATGMPGAV